MCQIFGLLNIKRADVEGSELIEQVTKLMLIKASEGNKDGAGIVLSYDDYDGFFMLKTPHSGEVLAKTLDLDKTRPFKHILGHTRFATQGSISEKNSHPHLGSHGAVVHNGWCPDLYSSIEHGWHMNAEKLHEKLAEMNEGGGFVSECDSEALALIFDKDPEVFAKNLIGDEVFAVAHMDNTGNDVTLMTQYNTVNMAYSHALEAVVFATSRSVVQAVLDYLGEQWPIAEVGHDKVYYFDGEDMTGGDFDFSEASMNNMSAYYEKYGKKESKADAITEYDSEGEIIENQDDLEVYFKERDKELENDPNWTRTVLSDGSSVWEHFSGEIIHSDTNNIDELNRLLAAGEDEATSKDFLDRDFEAIQKNIQEQIANEKDKD